MSVSYHRKKENFGCNTNKEDYSTRDQRSSEKAKWERLTEIVDFVKSISDIPVIVNGDVYKYADIEKAKKITRK